MFLPCTYTTWTCKCLPHLQRRPKHSCLLGHFPMLKACALFLEASSNFIQFHGFRRCLACLRFVLPDKAGPQGPQVLQPPSGKAFSRISHLLCGRSRSNCALSQTPLYAHHHHHHHHKTPTETTALRRPFRLIRVCVYVCR